MRKIFCVLLLQFAAAALVAQVVSPNLERGVSPGKAYATGDIDTVNLFNGNLNVAIPIGQQYPVNGSLSYGLTLHYAGNSWEQGTREDTVVRSGFNETVNYVWQYPSRHNNAGFGWRLSPGSLYVPEGATDWAYEAPDGSVHATYPTLHFLSSSEQATNVRYTRDGTYLRLKFGTPSDITLEFPNGDVHHFEAAGPSGARLKEIDDPYGNYVRISYNSTNIPDSNLYGGSIWDIYDNHGRHQYVYFRPTASYNETTAGVNVSHESVAEVRLTAFGGTTVRYIFTYENQGNAAWSVLSRPCPSDDPDVPGTTAATLLTQVDVKDAAGTTTYATYTMTYDHGNQSGCVYEDQAQPGTLSTLTTPTLAKYQWQYQPITFPIAQAGKRWLTHVVGVKERDVIDAGTNATLSRTTYEHALDTSTVPAKAKKTTVTTYDGGDGAQQLTQTISYFNTAQQYSNSTTTTFEYGLPYTPLENDGNGRYLSTKACLDTACSTARSQYVRYEADVALGTSNLGETSDVNRRVASQRTLFEDSKYTDVTNSEFDGLGHYRTSSSSGNFALGNSGSRVSHTHFNPNNGSYSIDANGNPTGGFVMPSTSSTWLLNTFTYSTITETTVNPSSPTQTASYTAMTQACFDDKGFLTRRRTIAANVTDPSAPTLAANDLLAVFTRGSNGNLLTEQYYGGDAGTAPTSNTCTASLGSDSYRIDHAYAYGAVATSTYIDGGGTAMSFKSVDRDIDLSTGFASTSRAAATSTDSGLATNFVFDPLGRLTTVKAGNDTTHRGSWTKFVYRMSGPPRVDEYDNANGDEGTTSPLAHRFSEFDVLGRPAREGRDLPSGTVVTTSKYNGAGWKTFQSIPGAAPTTGTSFTFDRLGRTTKITAPDNTHVDVVYIGASEVRRTATGATTKLMNTEKYDRNGRLVEVIEPSGTEAANTPPAGTKTDYSYDVGGRLAVVCANAGSQTCGQTRTFEYDQRGLLVREKNPERGASGNGTTEYPAYDARGHLKRRYDGVQNGAFDVSFAYDRAERLTSVQKTGDGRIIKLFEFGTSNDTANYDYKNGRPTRAIRFNWFDGPGYNMKVAETYEYRGRDGRISKRTTDEYDCTIDATHTCTSLPSGVGTREFVQTFTYDDLGNNLTLGHPDCIGCGLPSAPTATNTYTKGWLTGVSGSYVGSAAIAYSGSGMVTQVTHGNGVIDTQTTDETGMRPRSISTDQALEASSCTPPTIAQQPAVSGPSSGQYTITAAVSADSSTTVTYQWYIGPSGTTANPISNSNSNTLTVAPGQTTSYWVKATTSCGTAVSAAATINICSPPAITANPLSAAITVGQQNQLNVTATGGTLSYQWYQGTSGSGTAIAGATASSLTVAPSTGTSYWVAVSNGCGAAVNSSTATVTVSAQATAPTTFSASYNGSGITMSWGASSSAAGISYYIIQKSYDGIALGDYSLVYAPATSYTDTQVVTGHAYLYRVCAVDNHLFRSPYSGSDIATAFTFTDDALPQSGAIKGVHFSELRQAIDAVRRTAGLSSQWTDYSPLTGAVLLSQMNEIRTALGQARALLNLPDIVYTQPALQNNSPILGADITEVRLGVK